MAAAARAAHVPDRLVQLPAARAVSQENALGGCYVPPSLVSKDRVQLLSMHRPVRDGAWDQGRAGMLHQAVTKELRQAY